MTQTQSNSHLKESSRPLHRCGLSVCVSAELGNRQTPQQQQKNSKCTFSPSTEDEPAESRLVSRQKQSKFHQNCCEEENAVLLPRKKHQVPPRGTRLFPPSQSKNHDSGPAVHAGCVLPRCTLGASWRGARWVRHAAVCLCKSMGAASLHKSIGRCVPVKVNGCCICASQWVLCQCTSQPVFCLCTSQRALHPSKQVNFTPSSSWFKSMALHICAYQW